MTNYGKYYLQYLEVMMAHPPYAWARCNHDQMEYLNKILPAGQSSPVEELFGIKIIEDDRVPDGMIEFGHGPVFERGGGGG